MCVDRTLCGYITSFIIFPVAVSFSSPTYQVNENNESIRIGLLLTDKSSTDIAIRIKPFGNSSATGK